MLTILGNFTNSFKCLCVIVYLYWSLKIVCSLVYMYPVSPHKHVTFFSHRELNCLSHAKDLHFQWFITSNNSASIITKVSKICKPALHFITTFSEGKRNLLLIAVSTVCKIIWSDLINSIRKYLGILWVAGARNIRTLVFPQSDGIGS